MDVYLYFVTGILSVAILVMLYNVWSRHGATYTLHSSVFGLNKSESSLPSISKFNIIGKVQELKQIFGANAHEFLTTKCKLSGPIYRFGVFGQELVFLFDYRDICHLKEAEEKYPVHLDLKHLRLHREARNYPLGLLLSNGEEWRTQRPIYGKMLTGSISQTKYTPVINDVALTSIGTIDQGECAPMELIENYVTEAFCRVLYGMPHGCLDDLPLEEITMKKFIDVTRSNFADAKKLLVLPTCVLKLLPAWKRHNQRWTFLLETTMENIEKCQEADHRGRTSCVFADLLRSGKVKSDEMQVNLTDFTLASIDTTAITIIWCLYTVGSHPNVQENIVQEARENKVDTTKISKNDLHNLQFLKAVLKETLRLYPIATFTSRITATTMSVRGHHIQANTHVAMSMYVMGRNQDLFPEPDQFDPRRWLTGNKMYDRFYHDVPFGFGPRMCLGRKLAEKEIMLYLLQFCMDYKFMVTNKKIEPTTKMFLVPNEPIKLRLSRRCISI